MEKNANLTLMEQVNIWTEGVKFSPSFTKSDVEELKCHLLDSIDELKSAGLDDAEAFRVASKRLGNPYIFNSGFDEANLSVIQTRKVILLMAGVMVFFLFFFLMHFSVKLLVLATIPFKFNQLPSLSNIYYFIFGYHLLFILSSVIICLYGSKMVMRIESLIIKPWHTLCLFAGIISLAVSDRLLYEELSSIYGNPSFVVLKLNEIIDYTNYSFSLVIIACFTLIYKKYYRNTILPGQGEEEMQKSPANETLEEELKKIPADQLNDLKQIGLDDEEALEVLMKRRGLNLPNNNKQDVGINLNGIYSNSVFIFLSGVLVYFLLYFILHSTSRLFLVVLMYFKDEPSFGIKWTWTYVGAIHLILIFFVTSIYLSDIKLIERIKEIKIKPKHAFRIFLITLVSGILDRSIYPLSRMPFLDDKLNLISMERIFVTMRYSFPFLIFTCFLILFHKYYRENMRIG
jgi:hypothetical protein